ncbi:hypothetical protein [Hyphomicrobium sp. MC1]|uniref:hypothetical protein n=1 Tax=Hyphomicrobium sp. (strain MC1) TaxID=717785 RepID=UPI000213F235|nr:hypothetical protein [Hyphomicrobium sp. MC1]CCB66714.1 protein of unknown function [Hyphomicrobium sp. MC1]
MMNLDGETRRLLTEIAYLGCVTNQIARTRQILDGLAEGGPVAREVVIGNALLALTEGKPEGAVAGLRALSESGDPYGTAFLALALKLAGRGSELDAVLDRFVPGDDVSTDALVASLRGAA